MTEKVKPLIGFEANERKIIIKLEIDYNNAPIIDIDLLFDVLKGADRLILTINDSEMMSNMILDLSGALIFKNNDLILIHLTNQGCVLVRRDGKVVATPNCKSSFQSGESL
jgi:hypothetical protein